MSTRLILAGAVGVLLAGRSVWAAPDFNADVLPILRTYCLTCHNADDAEGELVLDSFEALGRGGEHGKVVVPGQSGRSRLLKVLTGKAKPVMPPKDNERPSDGEIATLRAWIDDGALAPQKTAPAVHVPKIKSNVANDRAIHALAFGPRGRVVAVARYGAVELVDADGHKRLRRFEGHAGHVNDVAITADGARLLAASGFNGRRGQLRIWRVADGKLLHDIKAHRDGIYAVAVSSDGKTAATGSYDHSIRLWNVETGRLVRVIRGHHGAIFDLDFHPSGKWLASASADRTAKLWSVETGERLDTLSQPRKEVFSVNFSPDGLRLAAGGADRRIRIWAISATARDGTNPLLISRFAHEGDILRVAFSPDGKMVVSSSQDQTVKQWEASQMRLLSTMVQRSDWAPALAVRPGTRQLFVGRVDGELKSSPLVPIEPAPASARQIQTPAGRDPAKTAAKQVSEREPNDLPAQATPLQLPAIAKGAIVTTRKNQRADADLYAVSLKSGEPWIVETRAAASKSKLDSRIDVLFADGKPVPRVKLRAIRDSWLTFRPLDSRGRGLRIANWEEMHLDQLLYLRGEVVKIFRMPQGPDSDMQLYPQSGSRTSYFDTSAVTHANGEPIYVVEPYPPSVELPPNGLPVFTVYYTNDDDSARSLGRDSRLTFRAPKDGKYLIRVSDVRGFQGDTYHYELRVRRPRPSFSVKIESPGKISKGSGKSIKCRVTRTDGFDGPIEVKIDHLPPGYSVASTIAIQAGQDQAFGVMTASPNAQTFEKAKWEAVRVTARATIAGKIATQQLGRLGEIKLEPPPKVRVYFGRDKKSSGQQPLKPFPVRISAGQLMVPVDIEIDRNGFGGRVTFDVLNLPHGVIVDNVGLNGVLIPPGKNRRKIFLSCESWVPPMRRRIHAVAKAAGNQASQAIELIVE